MSILNHMVKYSQAGLDAVFGALADATRRAILARLASGETSLSELAQPFVRDESTASPSRRKTPQKTHKMSLVAVQKHVRVLERAGLVETAKEGRVRRCTLQPKPLRNASEWIAFYQAFWEDQFDALDEFIGEMQKEDPSWRPQIQQNPQAPPPHPGAAAKSKRKSRASLPRRGNASSPRGRGRSN